MPINQPGKPQRVTVGLTAKIVETMVSAMKTRISQSVMVSFFSENT